MKDAILMTLCCLGPFGGCLLGMLLMSLARVSGRASRQEEGDLR